MASYGPQIDQSHGKNRLSHIIREGSLPNYSCNFLTAMNNTLSDQPAYWQFLKGTKTVMSAWRNFSVQLLQQ